MKTDRPREKSQPDHPRSREYSGPDSQPAGLGAQVPAGDGDLDAGGQEIGADYFEPRTLQSESLARLTPASDRARGWLNRATSYVPSLSLDERLGRLMLSIILAVLLWFYVVNLENPQQTTTFRNLRVDLRGTGTSLRVVNSVPPVDATMNAPQNVMAGFSQSDVRPYVDLTGLGAGVHKDLPVLADLPVSRGPSVDVRFSPSTVEVQLQIQASRVFTVVVQTTGTPAFGYGLEPPQVDPGQVEVGGPSDSLSRIAKVVVVVDVDGKASTEQGLKAPAALDSSGQEVKGLTFSPASVQVVMPIKLLLNYKVVPIRVPVEGQPAPGYMVAAITVDPTNATLCCSPSTLEPLQFLDTAPVAITNTTSTIITDTQMTLPSGVGLATGQTRTVHVTINVQALETTLEISVAPTVEGVQAGLTAVLSPPRLDVTVAGTYPQLQSLKPTDVQAVISVQGLGPGTYDLVPQIAVPTGVKLSGSSPARVTASLIAPTPVVPSPTAASPLATHTPQAPTSTATPTSTAPARPSPSVAPSATP